MLLSIAPDSHYAIRVTTLRLVGELADWIDQHPDNLELVLSFLMDGLHIPAMASYAASAVQKVCLRCKRKMAPHIDGLLQIIHAADNLGISNEATLGLLKGVTDVVTKMDCELMKSCVHSLCCFHIVYLQQVMHIHTQTHIRRHRHSHMHTCSQWSDILCSYVKEQKMLVLMEVMETHVCGLTDSLLYSVLLL